MFSVQIVSSVYTERGQMNSVRTTLRFRTPPNELGLEKGEAMRFCQMHNKSFKNSFFVMNNSSRKKNVTHLQIQIYMYFVDHVRAHQV